MQLWQDGLVAMLAAIGLASIMWAVVKTVLYGRQEERRQGVAALIPAQGDGEGLEAQVRALEDLGVFGTALLVDCGLSEEGRKLCQLLARKRRWLAICGKDEIGEYLAGM